MEGNVFLAQSQTRPGLIYCARYSGTECHLCSSVENRVRGHVVCSQFRVARLRLLVQERKMSGHGLSTEAGAE